MTSLIEHPYPIRPAAEVDPTGTFERAYLEVAGMSETELSPHREHPTGTPAPSSGEAEPVAMHPMGPKQTIIQEVWQRLEGPHGLMRNIDRSIIEKGVEVALHLLRRNGVTFSASPALTEPAEGR